MGDTAFIRVTSVPTGLRIAQVVGLTSTAFLAGKTFTQTVSAVPALLHAPAPLLARQWKTMFDSDKLLAPLIVVGSSGVFGGLAWREHSLAQAPWMHLSASLLLLATIPYSLILLEPLTQRLERKVVEADTTAWTDEVETKAEQTTHWLVDRWATVNLGRAVLSGIAAVVATWAGVQGVHIGGVAVIKGAETMGQ